MSDHSGGEGWWQASDGKWYPPETPPAHPGSTVVQPPSLGGDSPHWLKRSVPLWGLFVAAVIGLVVGVGAGSSSEPTASGERAAASSDHETSTTSRASTTTRPTTTTTNKTPTTTTTTTPPTTADPYAGESVSQRNARGKAADYLDFSAFSRSGLIKQLEFEGFSTADATYGVDAQNADWLEQAAKKAADYMEYSSFSRSGLIEQLKFEGFSQQEAEHGANSVGL